MNEVSNFIAYETFPRHTDHGTRRWSARDVLPCLDLAVLGHGAREFAIKLLQGGHICQGSVQKVTAQCFVANVINVVVTEKATSAEVIDSLHRGYTEALDAPQEILESY